MQPIDFWLPVAVIFVGNCFYFVICTCLKDNSWIDVLWGILAIEQVAAIIIA